MSDPKYAVYVVIVEDTAENDMDILTRGPAEEGERLKGDLSFDAAEELVADAVANVAYAS